MPTLLTPFRVVTVAIAMLAASLLVLSSASSASTSAALLATTTSTQELLGDRDGFGLGLVEGDTAPDGFFDNREADDPSFTDVLPASRESAPRFATLGYEHSFELPADPVVLAAELSWLTLGIQDGDAQVLGSDTDVRLFLDGVEVPGAFDDVDQFGYFDGSWKSVVGQVTIEVPPSMFPMLTDGHLSVTIETHALGSYAGLDAFAFDYSELTITHDSPTPEEPLSTAEGTFNPPIAPQGQTLAQFSGGSVAVLIATLEAADATSATATLPDGGSATVVVTTLSFVNADFEAAFPNGVPAGAILWVRALGMAQSEPPEAVPTPPPAPVNLAPNPSFEQGKDGIPSGWEPNPNGVFDAEFGWSESTALTGDRSVSITTTFGIDAVPLANPGWRTVDVIPVERGIMYEASVSTFTPDGGVGHWPAIQFFDADGSFLGTHGAVGPSGLTDPANEWVRKIFRIRLDAWPGLANAAAVRIVIVQDLADTKGTETTVYFDDVYFGPERE